jgi:hypothetical protein
MRICLLLMCLLCLAGCASNFPPSKAMRSGSDSLCVQDCLGNGGTREFCSDRCSY